MPADVNHDVAAPRAQPRVGDLLSMQRLGLSACCGRDEQVLLIDMRDMAVAFSCGIEPKILVAAQRREALLVNMRDATASNMTVSFSRTYVYIFHLFVFYSCVQ